MAELITKKDFEEKVLKSDKPVLVDFFAAWCGPCKIMAPTMDELAKELEGKAGIFKVDVDADSELANEYKVMSIPTIFIFKDGKPVNQLVGLHDKEALKKALDI